MTFDAGSIEWLTPPSGASVGVGPVPDDAASVAPGVGAMIFTEQHGRLHAGLLSVAVRGDAHVFKLRLLCVQHDGAFCAIRGELYLNIHHDDVQFMRSALGAFVTRDYERHRRTLIGLVAEAMIADSQARARAERAAAFGAVAHEGGDVWAAIEAAYAAGVALRKAQEALARLERGGAEVRQ